MSSPVISDASKSTQGIVHQLWVALEKCYEMGEGQCVVVEKEGDVTIRGVSTTEVKLYGYDDDLTDGHLNIWKTLRNWMDPNSHPEKYAALILRTNQSYGALTRFKGWNEANLDLRVSILEAILADSEARLRKESEKRILAAKTPAQPSDSHATHSPNRLGERTANSEFFEERSPACADWGAIPGLLREESLSFLSHRDNPTGPLRDRFRPRYLRFSSG